MKIDNLTDAQREAQIRQTVTEAEQAAYVAGLAAGMNPDTQEQADALEARARAMVAKAKEMGVEGPFLTDADRHGIHSASVASLEQAYLAAELRAAGGDEDVDLKALIERKKQLVKLAPPKPKGEPAGARRGLI